MPICELISILEKKCKIENLVITSNLIINNKTSQHKIKYRYHKNKRYFSGYLNDIDELQSVIYKRNGVEI